MAASVTRMTMFATVEDGTNAAFFLQMHGQSPTGRSGPLSHPPHSTQAVTRTRIHWQLRKPSLESHRTGEGREPSIVGIARSVLFASGLCIAAAASVWGHAQVVRRDLRRGWWVVGVAVQEALIAIFTGFLITPPSRLPCRRFSAIHLHALRVCA